MTEITRPGGVRARAPAPRAPRPAPRGPVRGLRRDGGGPRNGTRRLGTMRSRAGVHCPLTSRMSCQETEIGGSPDEDPSAGVAALDVPRPDTMPPMDPAPPAIDHLNWVTFSLGANTPGRLPRLTNSTGAGAALAIAERVGPIPSRRHLSENPTTRSPAPAAAATNSTLPPESSIDSEVMLTTRIAH